MYIKQSLTTLLVHTDLEADFGLFEEIGKKSSDNWDADAVEGHLDIAFKVGNNSQKLKKRLAKELMDHGLPKFTSDTQTLVVVTTLKSFDGLTGKDVWRGLSSRIEFEEWETYNPSERKKTKTSHNREEAQKNPIAIPIILLIISMVVLTILILMLASDISQPKQETPIQSSAASFMSKIERTL